MVVYMVSSNDCDAKSEMKERLASEENPTSGKKRKAGYNEVSSSLQAWEGL